MTSLTSHDTIDQARRREFVVLLVISTGLITILVLIVSGIFGWFPSRSNSPLPNWAENVLVSIGTASILKLGDCLAAVVQLASGRQVAQLGEKLANSTPQDATPPPETVVEAAQETADAAQEKADVIKGAPSGD